MPFTEYTCISGYLESKDTLAAKIALLNAAIDALEDQLLDLATSPGMNVSYYELDDDQVRIKTGYRSMADIIAGIDAMERRKQKFINKLNGRAFTMQDRSTMRGPGWPY